jgi:hypothetical protein
MSSRTKQANYGIMQAAAADEIALEMDKLRLQIREEGLPRITRAQLAAPLIKTGVKAFRLWISPRGLSVFESIAVAKKEVLKELLRENMDEYLRKFVSSVFEIARRHADEVVEVMLNGS